MSWNGVKRMNTFTSVENEISDDKKLDLGVEVLSLESPISGVLDGATPLILEFYGFSVQTTPINRVSPAPPSALTDSIVILGTRPTILSWNVTAAGGAYTHPTQTNTVQYYPDVNGGGSPSSVVESWILNLRRVSGANIWTATVGVNSTRVSWGWSNQLILGGVSQNKNISSYLTDQNNEYGNDERWGLGGFFRLYRS